MAPLQPTCRALSAETNKPVSQDLSREGGLPLAHRYTRPRGQSPRPSPPASLWNAAKVPIRRLTSVTPADRPFSAPAYGLHHGVPWDPSPDSRVLPSP